MEYERVKLETAADREKTAVLTSRVAELKEQLKRAEEQNTNLASDLKQSQEALLHLGRSASGATSGPGSLGGSGRMYTSMMSAQHGASSRAALYSGNNTMMTTNENANPTTTTNTTNGMGLSGGLSSSTFAPAPITLFREFAKGNNSAATTSSTPTPSFQQQNLTATGGGGLYSAGKYLNNNYNNTSMNTPSSSMFSSQQQQTSTYKPSASGRSAADPMSMLRNVAAGGSNTPSGVTSAYFPSA